MTWLCVHIRFYVGCWRGYNTHTHTIAVAPPSKLMLCCGVVVLVVVVEVGMAYTHRCCG